MQNEGKTGSHTSTDKEQNQGCEEFRVKVELTISNCTEKLNKQKENRQVIPQEEIFAYLIYELKTYVQNT